MHAFWQKFDGFKRWTLPSAKARDSGFAICSARKPRKLCDPAKSCQGLPRELEWAASGIGCPCGALSEQSSDAQDGACLKWHPTHPLATFGGVRGEGREVDKVQ